MLTFTYCLFWFIVFFILNNLVGWSKELWIIILSVLVLIEVRIRLYEKDLIKKAMEKKEENGA
jgi:predicted membrane protein